MKGCVDKIHAAFDLFVSANILAPIDARNLTNPMNLAHSSKPQTGLERRTRKQKYGKEYDEYNSQETK